MNKLQRLKEIIDHQLRHVTMSESEKAEVRRRIESGETGRRPVSRRIWAYSAGAVALAGLVLALVVLPGIRARNEQKRADMAASAAGSSSSSSSGSSSSAAASSSSAAPSSSMSYDAGGDSFTDASGLTFQVTAEQTKGGVTARDTRFVITVSGGRVDADNLKQRISLNPDVDFTIRESEKTRYVLEPETPFGQGEIVTLSIRSETGETRSWAFQTESSLRVVSTIPGNDAENMPAETGIEISFSRTVSSGMEDHFEIVPAISGHFLFYGKTVAFVPDDPLAADTFYTVTVTAGLTADSGEALEEDYSFRFRTPQIFYDRDTYFYLADGLTETFLPDDPVAIGIYTSEKGADSVSVELFRAPDADAWLSLAEDYYENREYRPGRTSVISTDGLTRIDSFEAKIEKPQNYWWGPSYVMLPKLDAGWYCAVITRGEDTICKLIQISTLSVYYQSLNGETFLWVNDTVTGSSVSGAAVRLSGGGKTESAVTGADGTVRVSFERGDDSSYAALRIDAGGRTFADYAALDRRGKETAYDRYYSFVYLDRTLYQPTDTVHFWGILLPRNGAALPAALDLETSIWGEPRKVGSVRVNTDGTFTGSYSFENSVSGYVNLGFCMNDEQVCSSSFSVMEYTKPAYVMTAEFDKPYYRAKDDMEVSIHGEFFDGTPASGLQVTTSFGDSTNTAVLDAEGNLTVPVTPVFYNIGDWTPTNQYLNVSTSGAEDVYVSAYANAPRFRSDYMLTTEQGDDGRVTLRANAIRFDVYEQHLDDYYSFLDEMRGAAADVSGTVTVLRSYFVKTSTGSYYDPINKLNVETYDYDYREDVAESYDFTTSGGIYVAPALQDPDYSDSAYYRMEIRYTTPDGADFETSLYLSRAVYPGSWYRGYYVQRIDKEESEMLLGETGSFGIFSQEQVTGGSALFTVVTDRVLESSVTGNGRYDMRYGEEMLPNVMVYGAYFDGRHVYAANPAYIRFDSSQRELKVELTPEQDTYGPGDEVKGTLRITDRDGNPVSAHYALGVVDEALFALMDQEIDPAGSLYAWRYDGYALRYTSYVDKEADNAMAEGGGEGGAESARREFLDTAAFLTGDTDAGGTASFSFRVPDNLTSWRITAAAATSSGYAGHGTSQVAVSIPYFINLVMNERYTAGDDLSLSARIYGADYGADAAFTVLVDGETKAERTGVVGAYTRFNLGKLPAGSYEITILAGTGDFHDGITRTVQVMESRHQITAAARGELSGPIQIDAIRYPVTMIFHDADRQVYAGAVSRLLCMSGARLDQNLAAPAAAAHLKVLFPDAAYQADDPVLQSYQDYSGGLRLFPYADADAVTTAMALLTGADYIDTAAAEQYLERVLSDYESTSTQVAAAYLGLAVQRQPVLADVRNLAANPKGFSVQDRLLLADALAVLGDDSGAETLYDSLVRSRMKSTDSWCWLDAGDAEANYAATADAALLAGLLGAPEQDLLVRYLLENDSRETLPAFALMAYVQHRSIPASSASFSCRYGGQVKTWSFDERPIAVLEFTKSELESADFKVLSGKVGYTAVYTGGIGDVTDNAGDRISVSVNFNPTETSFGDPLAVTAYVDFADDCPGELYSLDVVLPSGTRFSGFENAYEKGIYLINSENNRVTFLLDRRMYRDGMPSSLRNSFIVNIKVRAVLDGEFVLEPAVVRGLSSSLNAVGSTKTLTIR